MKRFNINARLIKVIQNLYEKAISAIYYVGKVGELLTTRTGVRQGCILSPTLFNIMLEQIMNEAILDHKGTVSIGGRVITNLRFTDYIDGLAGSDHELVNLMTTIDSTSRTYGMEINSFIDNRQSQRPTNKSEGEKATVVWSYHSRRLLYVKNIPSRYCKWHRKERSSETEMVLQHVRVDRTKCM